MSKSSKRPNTKKKKPGFRRIAVSVLCLIIAAAMLGSLVLVAIV